MKFQKLAIKLSAFDPKVFKFNLKNLLYDVQIIHK